MKLTLNFIHLSLVWAFLNKIHSAPFIFPYPQSTIDRMQSIDQDQRLKSVLLFKNTDDAIKNTVFDLYLDEVEPEPRCQFVLLNPNSNQNVISPSNVIQKVILMPTTQSIKSNSNCKMNTEEQKQILTSKIVSLDQPNTKESVPFITAQVLQPSTKRIKYSHAQVIQAMENAVSGGSKSTETPILTCLNQNIDQFSPTTLKPKQYHLVYKNLIHSFKKYFSFL